MPRRLSDLSLVLLVLLTGAAAAFGVAGSPSPRPPKAPVRTAANSTPTTTTTTTARLYEESLGAKLATTVLGDSLTAAQAALAATGSIEKVKVTAQVVNPAVAAETVLSQTSPAGTLLTVPVQLATHPVTFSVTIAVPPTTPCTATQLGVTFVFNQGSGGDLIGDLVLYDVSPTWCILMGPIMAVGLSSMGEPVTPTVSFSVTNTQVDALSPNASAPTGSTIYKTGSGIGELFPVSVFWAQLSVAGPDCAHANEPNTQTVTPAAWEVSLPGAEALTTRNGTRAKATNPALSTTGRDAARPLSSCQGALTTGIPNANVQD